jgi:hypothetical protein
LPQLRRSCLQIGPLDCFRSELIQVVVPGLREIRLDRKRRAHIHSEEDSQIAESADLFRLCVSELDSGTRSGSPGNIEIENSDIARLKSFPHALRQFVGNFIRIACHSDLFARSDCLPEGCSHVTKELTRSILAARRLAIYICLRCCDPRASTATKFEGLAYTDLCVDQI